MIDDRQAGGFFFREAGPADGPLAVMVHGFPESSWAWRSCLEACAERGIRAVAPDLPGFGGTPVRGDGTWEDQIEALDAFVAEVGAESFALCVRDWGGLIGLRWACDNPDPVRALVICSTGFFSDGKWHGMAEVMRTPEQGEQLMEMMTRDLFATALRQSTPGLDDETVNEYWRCVEDPERAAAKLALYRSGDFEKLTPYEGRLAALGLPALVVSGANDEFAPVAGAKRLARELDAELVVIDDAGHFLGEEVPDEVGRTVGDFLARTIAAGS